MISALGSAEVGDRCCQATASLPHDHYSHRMVSVGEKEVSKKLKMLSPRLSRQEQPRNCGEKREQGSELDDNAQSPDSLATSKMGSQVVDVLAAACSWLLLHWPPCKRLYRTPWRNGVPKPPLQSSSRKLLNHTVPCLQILMIGYEAESHFTYLA